MENKKLNGLSVIPICGPMAMFYENKGFIYSATLLRNIQEFVGFGNETLNQVFKHPLSLKDGYVFLEDKPGLGVDYEEVLASSYPYKRSYLPVTRLEDGTLWNW